MTNETIADKARELTERETELVRLLWDYLKRDPRHKDRRQTAWGTKTQVGLVNTIAYIVNGKHND